MIKEGRLCEGGSGDLFWKLFCCCFWVFVCFIISFSSLPFFFSRRVLSHKSKALQKIYAQNCIYNTLATDNRVVRVRGKGVGSRWAWVGKRLWATGDDAVCRWCSVELDTWNLYSCANQCHPPKNQFKKMNTIPTGFCILLVVSTPLYSALWPQEGSICAEVQDKCQLKEDPKLIWWRGLCPLFLCSSGSLHEKAVTYIGALAWPLPWLGFPPPRFLRPLLSGRPVLPSPRQQIHLQTQRKAPGNEETNYTVSKCGRKGPHANPTNSGKACVVALQTQEA